MKPPRKPHYVRNKYSRRYHRLIFGKTLEEVGISYDPKDIVDEVPARAEHAGEFQITKQGAAKIIGAFIIKGASAKKASKKRQKTAKAVR